MNINALVTSQFRRYMNAPWSELSQPKCIFEKLVVNLRRQIEAGQPFTLANGTYQPFMVAECGYKLNEYCKKDTQIIEGLIKEELEKHGLLHSMINEEREPQAIAAGSYVLHDGKRFVLETELLPCDEFLGHPIYKHGDLSFTVEQVKEDAPVNAVGHGNIAGVSPGQEPPGKRGLYFFRNKKKTKELKKKL
jgi:hypothetical protein